MKIAYIIKRIGKPTTITFSQPKAMQYKEKQKAKIEKVRMIPNVYSWSE